MPPSRNGRLSRGGSPTSDRLASRGDNAAGRRLGSSLRPHGGGGQDVFTGDLARQALKALGARAMTVDNSIIVDPSLDTSRPEDQALLAHEQFHLSQSGGTQDNHGRDAEEIAARAVERMVLHTAKGGTETHESKHTEPGQGGGQGARAVGAGGDNAQKAETRAMVERGYLALRHRGLSHDEIVRMLARDILTAMDAQREHGAGRFSDKKGFL